jgi:hypothetical protein
VGKIRSFQRIELNFISNNFILRPSYQVPKIILKKSWLPFSWVVWSKLEVLKSKRRLVNFQDLPQLFYSGEFRQNQWKGGGYSLWLQAREATPEKQQPTANERLLAARARAPHEAERHWGTNERLLAESAASNTREATTYNQWAAVGCKQEQEHQRGNNLQPMSGCWLQARARAPHEAERHWSTNERLLMMEIEEKASLWLQAREATPERQQPTTNERLLAASALPVAASKRSNTREATTYSQWTAVGCKRFACGCKQEKQHQRGNNLQPMSGCWLQARAKQEHHMRQRDIEAPMSGC